MQELNRAEAAFAAATGGAQFDESLHEIDVAEV